MKRKSTEAERAAKRFDMLMGCQPGQGPEPVADLDDALNALRLRRGLPPIKFPTTQDETSDKG